MQSTFSSHKNCYKFFKKKIKIKNITISLLLLCLKWQSTHKTCKLKFIFAHLLLFFLHNAASQSTGFSLQLIPWDSPQSPLHQPNLTQTQKIQIMAISSKARATSLSPKNATFSASTIQIPMNRRDLRYSVRIRIGSPAKETTLLLDTGSGPIWTKCNQSGRGFNFAKSRTYKSLPCQHPLCQQAEHMCKCVKKKCVCTLEYGIEASQLIRVDAVVLSSDSFTLPIKNTFSNMIFGCSKRSPIFSGILGMDKTPLSLISQVRNKVNGRFSYCLHGGAGYLRFGNDIPRLGKKAKTITILHPHHPAMWLNLTDISIDKERLRLDPALFSNQQDGFFIDTGASFTVLHKQAYDRVIQALANYYNGKLKRVNAKAYHLDLCYKSDTGLRSYASMTFHFQGADYVTSNLFVEYGREGVMCIGLVDGPMSILGAMQQWDTRFVFDINKNTLQFRSEDCSKDRA